MELCSVFMVGGGMDGATGLVNSDKALKTLKYSGVDFHLRRSNNNEIDKKI